MTAVSTHDPETVLATLEMLDSILMEVREKVGDQNALADILPKLVELVGEALPRLADLKTGPEEKAQMVRLREQIAELERLLQTRESILARFSLYLKERVEG